MTAFEYVGGELHAEQVPLARIAREVGTPVYVYAVRALRESYQEFASALRGVNAEIHYAIKANSNLAVIRTFGVLGAGADVVSGGELRRALAAGIPADRIVYSGVGKTASELELAVASGIRQVNVESRDELDMLDGVAGARGRPMDIAIRVNPDVDAGTHAKITTGRKENKFGIDIDLAREAYAHAATRKNLRVRGVAMHLGSQILSLAPYQAALRRLGELVRNLRDDGHAIERLDVGGGLGIRYRTEQPPAASAFGDMLRAETAGLGCALSVEPGRLLVGNAGILLVSVVVVKPGTARTFAVVDGAMNDLIRPTLYDAWHEIVPVRERAAGPLTATDVVGPICESGDFLAQGRDLPPLVAGDLLKLRSAGAYGAVMASTYNSRPLVPEVLVDGERYAVVRPRQTVEELIAADRIPPWLGSG